MKRFEKSQLEQILPVDCLPCTDEFIVGKFIKEIGEDVIKADDIDVPIKSSRFNWDINIILSVLSVIFVVGCVLLPFKMKKVKNDKVQFEL